ncbi:MAG TPA: FtsX-like permease family protein, partial [Chitinophagaceae bacterium]|nr:FtsX-like permease family protein [Chitinophagaceae bacterium]
DVENYVRIKESWGKNFIKAEGKTSREEVVYADPQVIDVFSFKLKAGNLKNPLGNPHNIVLTEETAKRLFGQTNPIGKRLEIKVDDTFEPFVVSAIAENLPVNSSIQFKILGSFHYFENSEGGKWAKDSWTRSGFQTYVQLRPGSTLANDPLKLAVFYKKYYPDEEAELRKKGTWREKGSPVTYALQPLLSMHTETAIVGGAMEPVNPKTIWLLLSIAASVLIIACINFTTLAIGRSAGRAKEVGIRKVIGSRKKDLVFQFMMEAFLLTMVSAAVGVLLSKLLLPYFNMLSGRELAFSFQNYPELAWLIAALVIVAGLLAGGYPSLVLSGFRPIEVLKSRYKVGGSNIFTKSLVTLQFILSVGLIISTLVIMQQLKFMRTKNPGFNKENMIIVDAEGTDGNKVYPLFKEEIIKNPAVTGIASSELGIGEGAGWSRSGFDYNGKHKEVYEYFIDNDYLNVMNIPLLAGRNFNPALASDTVTSVIINEAMMKDMGWTIDNAIGQQLNGYSETKTPVVIGVVKDFHFRPFSEKVLPQLFHQFSLYKPFKFFIRIKEGDPSKVLTSFENAWKKVVPDLPFKFSFLDEDIDRFYKSEIRWSHIVGLAGGIAIFLACLGLLGLAALATINRTKEIGIRKVLGASVSNIIALLSKDFLKLVLLAFIIATPLAWYFMKQWLQDFAYRIDISWWVFAVTGLFAVLIALITICFQGIKTAIGNPIKNLRTE